MTWGVRDLRVDFGRRRALDGVTLEVPNGSVIGVIGGDGAGKTTLLRTLAGAAAPTSGTVRRPPQHRLGYMSAGPGVYLDLSVSENLAFVATAYGLAGDEDAERLERLLARTGLGTARDRLAGKLSGGMRQKLALAMALLPAPDLLILDEPTTGVDPVSRLDLWRLVAGAAAGGAGVVFSTTYVDEAERAERVLVLHEGRPLAWAPADEIIATTPGSVVTSGDRPVELEAWRRGSGWRAWSPDGRVPDGAMATVGDLEDAMIVLELAAEAMARAGDRVRRCELMRGVTSARGTSSARGALAEAAAATRRFADVTAVEAVDLRVGSGEVVGLLGANGAGKTTLIRMLLGLLAPTGGRLQLFGEAPSVRTRRRTGYLPQGLGLYDDLTVGQNLAFVAGAFGVHDPPALPADLDAVRDDVVRDLSLGLRRRVAFAAALSHDPDLLVLDEPTSGVEPLAGARLWETIREAAERGAGVLITTHNMEESAQCDRLVVMVAGRVAASGTAAEVIGDARAVAVRTDRWSAAFDALDTASIPVVLSGRTLRAIGGDTEAVDAALRNAGVAASVEAAPATFEEAFVALTLASAAPAP